MVVSAKLTLRPFLIAVSLVRCTPTFALLDATTATYAASVRPSRSQNLHRIMIKQTSDSEFSSDASATRNEEPSGKPPTVALFPPTSKYHPDRNGLSRRRRWLVVDFDGTCTEHDTTLLLPRLAAFAARQKSCSSAVCKENSDDSANNDIHKHDLERRLSQFRILEEEFFRLHMEAKSALLPRNKTGGEGGEKETSFHDVLDALDAPSNIVTQLVSESRVLEGLGHVDASELGKILQLHGVSTFADDNEHKIEGEANDDIDTADEEFDKVTVRLRHGCERTLARILSDENKSNERNNPSSCLGWSIAVLSINWCPALIDACIVQPVLRKRRSILRIDSCETEIPIWSNHVSGEGIVSLHVPGALAKRDRIMELRRHVQQRSGDSNVIVYVGDSSTDLAALLEADVGIIIGQSSSMISLAQQWGVQIVPSQRRNQHGFGTSSVNEGDTRLKEKLLWQVENWQQIDEMLIELDEHWL